MLKKIINKVIKIIYPLKAKKYKNLYLPYGRSNEALLNDKDYIDSAIQQVQSLEKYYEINSETKILDFGCGQGRFANGLLSTNKNFKTYLGIDTDLISIKWCNKWIKNNRENLHFLYLEAHNERYNPKAGERLSFPIELKSFNIAFLNSVFSHMLVEDIKFYLDELYKVLANNGLLYCTAFIDNDVMEVEENPKDYLGKKTHGPLHRVRYEKTFFLKLLENAGFTLENYIYQGINRTKQSEIIARKLL
tara:strand:+ start:99 stop:842 length:744 start_codon:yes stop_codon:yes gene_type:complete